MSIFRRNVIWITLGYGFYFGYQWVIIMILAKYGTPVDVGKYMLVVSICTPIISFFNMNLRTVQASDIKNEFVFKSYFWLRIINSFFALSIIIFYGTVISNREDIVILLLLFGIFKFLESISDIFYGFFQKKEVMNYIGISQIIKGSALLISSSACFIVTKSLNFTIFTMIIISFIVVISYDYQIYKKIKDTNDDKIFSTGYLMNQIKKIYKLAWPLSIVVLISTLIPNVPRYFISYYLNDYFLGIFTAVAYLSIIGAAFITAVGQVAIPRIATYFYENQINKMLGLLKKLVLFGISIGLSTLVIMYFFGELILAIIYTTEYSKYNNLMLIITAGATIQFGTMFLGAALHALRKYNYQLINNIILIISIFILGIILIPKYGISGAAYVVSIGYFIESLGYIFWFTLMMKKNNKLKL